MDYQIFPSSVHGTVSYTNHEVHFIAAKKSDDAGFGVTLCFPSWEEGTYVFLPACAYDGNRFRRVMRRYPPMYQKEELGITPEPLMSFVPALEPDGSGKMEVTTGDCAVPCVGLFYPEKKQALFLFCEQQCKDKNIGFSIERGSVTVQYPSMRESCYIHCVSKEEWGNFDSGISVEAGEEITSKLLIKPYSCESIPQFYEIFFKIRKCLLSGDRAPNLYSDELWDLMEWRFNTCNWGGKFYADDYILTEDLWSIGWTGGAMVTAALLKLGNELTRNRAIKTIDFLTEHLAPCGYFEQMKDSLPIGNTLKSEAMKDCTLVRRQGDVLYFLFKQFELTPPKKKWIAAAKRVSDALADLYEKYGDFGQFVNYKTGEMMYGGTTSAASVIGALALAWKHFGDERYLSIAKRAGEQYYRNYVEKGLTYGGPEEAMCAPDSESAFAMVESMVVLYEIAQEEKWLTYAKDSVHLFSSWVVTYPYRFPKDSEFARLGINSVGSVFANVQNKHAAPGICTASGDVLYRLYTYTGNRDYLELLKDIVFFIPQCVPTAERPIYTKSKHPEGYPPEKQILPPGAINERVNMSDWEPNRVGGVFYGSCRWCEAAFLLSYSELVRNREIAPVLIDSPYCEKQPLNDVKRS